MAKYNGKNLSRPSTIEEIKRAHDHYHDAAFHNKPFGLCVPPEEHDADIVISHAIKELAALRAWKEKARPYLVEMKIKKLGDLIRATENARNESETSAFKICMEANKSQLIREYEELKQLLEEE